MYYSSKIVPFTQPKVMQSKGDLSFSSGGYAIVPPDGFTWPSEKYPISVTPAEGYAFNTTFSPEDYARPALAGPTYYVNGTTGSDANTGLSLAQAVKSIWKATQLGNAAAVPFNVQVAAITGGYPRENGFSNSSTPVPNTQPAAYIATGGIAECWVGSTLAWGAADATFTNTYKVARSNVSQVIDVSRTDSNGDYLRLVQVADAATCNTTPNSWAQVTTDLYVHLTNNDAVTNTNTRVILKAVPNVVTDGTSKNLYIKNFALQGGASGCVAMTAAATMNFIAVNCSAKYAGDSATNVNGWKLDYITGLVALVNCTASQNEADGFNTHWTPGGTPAIYTLTINCKGYNNGRDTVFSCNGITSHDGAVGIDINGEYYSNYGTNVIPINSCMMWCLGTYSHDSVGDVSHGGTSPPRDYETQSTAKMWLQNCRSANSATAAIAANTSTLYTRNLLTTSGQAIGGGGGKITNF
jgi:hypothetical protein